MNSSAAGEQAPDWRHAPLDGPAFNGGQGASPAASQPSPAAPQQPLATAPQNPPLALEGHCPVTLAEEQNWKKKWAKGDPRWGAIHRGRLYLFTGPEQQQKFLAAPDRYAPAMSGVDAVLLTDEGRAVEGNIRSGVFYGEQVFLFTSEATLRRFWENPERYADAARTALRQNAPRRPR